MYALDTRVTGELSGEEFLAGYGGNIIERNRFVATFPT
ncbi:hypothetical protein ABH917_004011 [Thermobifida halotolerans]